MVAAAFYECASRRVKTQTDSFGRLADEYLAALRAQPPDCYRQLLDCGIPWAAIRATIPASQRVALGLYYQPDEHGVDAWIIPVGVDEVESSDPLAVVGCRRPGSIVDLIAFNPSKPRAWSLRRGEATVLGAVLPQWGASCPVSIHVDVSDWLRTGCTGLLLLTTDKYEAGALLRQLTRVVPRDTAHREQLLRLLTLPTRHQTAVLLPGEDCDEDQWGWDSPIAGMGTATAADRPRRDEFYDW